jgi:hypothetical protein
MPLGVIGELPALPLHTAGKYVAGAYVVLFALVLIYVAIMAIRLARIESELGELLSMSAPSPQEDRPQQASADGQEPDPQRESTPAYPMEGHS